MKHVQALQAYEAQVSSLVRGMSRLEEELHKAQEEKAALLSDLASVRELCVKLDSGKELTARQLTSKSMDLERVRFTMGSVDFAFNTSGPRNVSATSSSSHLDTFVLFVLL